MFSEIVNQLKGELTEYHPFATIREREAWDGLDPEWRREAVRLGEEYLGFVWPYMSATDFMDYSRTGNRVRFESRFFSKRHALSALVLAECVENQGRFLDDIVNGIYSTCDENAWNLPAHNGYYSGERYALPDLTRPIIDLFACETGSVMATVVYLLEPVLDEICPVITRRIRYELERRILAPYLGEYFAWMGNGKDPLNNWTPWCTQNVLHCAFLASGCEERRMEILKKACRSLDYFLEEYGDDGCCDEGAQYYHHAGLCLAAILDLCNGVTRGAFESIARETRIRNMADYIFKVHVDDIYYVNFADCSPVAGRLGGREFLFAKMTENPDMMAFVAEDFRSGLPRTLLLKEENNLFHRLMNAFFVSEMRACRSGQTPVPPDVFYPSVGLMVVRDDKLLLAAKAGDNGDSHNHNDVGSFTIYRDGKPMFIDIGVETYTQKTFSSRRYEIWTMQSSWHNLPEINGFMQLPGEAYRAEDVNCTLEDCTLTMELAGAYPGECGIRSYQREVHLEKGREIVVRDSFSFEGASRGESAAGKDFPVSGREGKNCLILNLLTYEKPVPEEGAEYGAKSLRIGEDGGRLLLENAHVKAIETVPITDARLQNAWKHDIHRILVEPETENMVLRIS